jgi:FKBP-type peptidyl-prolyl cis-trans isomerase SlpA
VDSDRKRVERDSFLTLHYRLADPDGVTWIDTFADKPATLSLGTGELAPAIEACLLGLPEGANERFELAAGAAFGSHNPELVQRVARGLLAQWGDPDEQHQVGDVVSFPAPDGASTFAGLVREASADALVFDFNHPLAGRPVVFDVFLIGVL